VRYSGNTGNSQNPHEGAQAISERVRKAHQRPTNRRLTREADGRFPTEGAERSTKGSREVRDSATDVRARARCGSGQSSRHTAQRSALPSSGRRYGERHHCAVAVSRPGAVGSSSTIGRSSCLFQVVRWPAPAGATATGDLLPGFLFEELGLVSVSSVGRDRGSGTKPSPGAVYRHTDAAEVIGGGQV